jgi:hypothetical protein
MDNSGLKKSLYWLLSFEDEHLYELSSLPFPTQLKWKHVVEIHSVLTNPPPPTSLGAAKADRNHLNK